MPKDKNENGPSAPFAPASGYATVRYDAMTGWCVIVGGSVMRSRFVSELAANEVCAAINGERQAAKFYRDTLETIAGDLRKTRGRRLAESALMFWDSMKSHNRGLSNADGYPGESAQKTTPSDSSSVSDNTEGRP